MHVPGSIPTGSNIFYFHIVKPLMQYWQFRRLELSQRIHWAHVATTLNNIYRKKHVPTIFEFTLKLTQSPKISGHVIIY